MEKQKWCAVDGTAIFCPEVVSEAWDAITAWASEAGTEELMPKINIKFKKRKSVVQII